MSPDGRGTDPHPHGRAAEARDPARGAVRARPSTRSTRIGVDTAEMRGDSRSLVFDARRPDPGDDAALRRARPTSRPAPPTSGITGKDVLLEQRDRVVYEILDLGYGACRMVLAAREGDESLGESERRLGAMRIATKYPRIAERHFDETGRQAEVIDVKGSVELAPLVGLADGIVDLVATGRTLEENGLEVREEIAASHRAPGRQPRLAQAPRRRGRRPGRAPAAREAGSLMKVTRFDWDGADPRGLAGAGPRAAAAAWSRSPTTSPRSSPTVASGGDAAVLAARASASAARRPRALRVRDEELEAARDAIAAEVCATRSRLAGENVRRVAEAEAMADLRGDPRRRASRSGCAASRSPRPAPTRPAAPPSYPSSALMCRVPARSPGSSGSPSPRPPRRGRRRSTRSCSPPLDRRRRRGLRDRRRPGDRRARARHRVVEPVDVIVGPGNRYVQEAKRQVTAGSGSTASPARAS